MSNQGPPSAAPPSEAEEQAWAARARELFCQLDSDGSGRLDAAELLAALRQHGVPATPTTVAKLRRRFSGAALADAAAGEQPPIGREETAWMTPSSADKQHALDITEDEFVRFYCKRAAKMRHAYQAIADAAIRAGGSGVGSKGISAADIRRAITMLDLKVSIDDVDRLLASIDINRDGCISYREFEEFVLLLPAVNVQAAFDIFDNTVVIESPHPEWSPHMNFFSRHSTKRRELSEDDKRHARQQLIAGGIAGVLSRTFTAPIDRVRLLMQSAGATGRVLAAGPPSASKAVPAHRLSAAAVVRGVFSHEGVKGFWRGNGANVVKIAPESAVRFASFEFLKHYLARDPDNVTVRERFVAGGVAGVIGQTLIYPLEIARTCLSVSPAGTYKGITDCTISIFRQGGSRALYNGWGASTLGIMPYAGLDLGINSLLRERVAQYYQGSDTEPGIVTMLGCGMVSATVAMLVTYPIGLVRTRLQASSIPGSPKFNGIVDCTRQTYKGGGLRAFYRGVVPTTVKVVPAAAISYAGYVWISEYLERRYTTMLATA